MGGFIALYVTACLNLGNPGSCVTEFVTDSTQNQMTMTGCLGVEGLSSAKDFVEQHPLVTRMDEHKGRSNRTQERTQA
jgi:hypothetical protein